ARLHLRLHLAPRHPAAHALRPVHALRLEVAHPDRPRLDRRPGVHPQVAGRGHARPAGDAHRRGRRRRPADRHLLPADARRGRRARGGRATGVRRLRRWIPRAPAARAARGHGHRTDHHLATHGWGRAAMSTLKETLWDPVAGFGVTFRTMFKKPVTEQYPFEKLPTAPRFHGRHQLNRWPDGLEKCVGCELCAWACPADAIYVEGADNTDDERFSPGERYGRVYQINYLRCSLCGLCIEACPT